MKRKTLEEVADLFVAAGIPFTAFEGGKHIRINAEGLPPIFLACSASDWRAIKNKRAQIKRLILDRRQEARN